MQEIAFQSIRNKKIPIWAYPWTPFEVSTPSLNKSCNTFLPIHIQVTHWSIYIYLEGQLPSIIGRKSESKHGRHGGLLDVSFRPLRGQRPIKIRLTIVRTHRPPLATRLIYTNAYVAQYSFLPIHIWCL